MAHDALGAPLIGGGGVATDERVAPMDRKAFPRLCAVRDIDLGEIEEDLHGSVGGYHSWEFGDGYNWRHWREVFPAVRLQDDVAREGPDVWRSLWDAYVLDSDLADRGLLDVPVVGRGGPTDVLPEIPAGWPGLMVRGTDHVTRRPTFVPAGGPCVADHDGDGRYSSYRWAVFGDSVDTLMRAGEHAWSKVTLYPEDDDKLPFQGVPGIAWHLTHAHDGTGYGLFCDRPYKTYTRDTPEPPWQEGPDQESADRSPGTPRPISPRGDDGVGYVYGFLSHYGKGGVNAGAEDDQHFIATNEYGEVFNSGHYSVNSYRNIPGTSPWGDGPAEHDTATQYQLPCRSFGFWQQVFMRWDPSSRHSHFGEEKVGLWRRQTRTPWSDPTWTPTGRPPWVPYDNPEEDVPRGGGGGGGGGGDDDPPTAAREDSVDRGSQQQAGDEVQEPDNYYPAPAPENYYPGTDNYYPPPPELFPHPEPDSTLVPGGSVITPSPWGQEQDSDADGTAPLRYPEAPGVHDSSALRSRGPEDGGEVSPVDAEGASVIRRPAWDRPPKPRSAWEQEDHAKRHSTRYRIDGDGAEELGDLVEWDHPILRWFRDDPEGQRASNGFRTDTELGRIAQWWERLVRAVRPGPITWSYAGTGQPSLCFQPEPRADRDVQFPGLDHERDAFQATRRPWVVRLAGFGSLSGDTYATTYDRGYPYLAHPTGPGGVLVAPPEWSEHATDTLTHSAACWGWHPDVCAGWGTPVGGNLADGQVFNLDGSTLRLRGHDSSGSPSAGTAALDVDGTLDVTGDLTVDDGQLHVTESASQPVAVFQRGSATAGSPLEVDREYLALSVDATDGSGPRKTWYLSDDAVGPTMLAADEALRSGADDTGLRRFWVSDSGTLRNTLDLEPGRAHLKRGLSLGRSTDATLSSDVLDPPAAVRVTVAAESGTTDDLWEIDGSSATDGDVLILTADTGDTITVRDAAKGGAPGANIYLDQGSTYDLATRKNLTLLWHHVAREWHEIARGDL